MEARRRTAARPGIPCGRDRDSKRQRLERLWWRSFPRRRSVRLVFTARIPNPGVTRGGLAFGLVNGRLRRLPARLGWEFPRRAAAFPVQAGVDSLAAATFLFLLVFRPFPISTGAMEDTLSIGDYVLVRVVLSPSRGDLVLFRYPVDPRQVFVKRVVATGSPERTVCAPQDVVHRAVSGPFPERAGCDSSRNLG